MAKWIKSKLEVVIMSHLGPKFKTAGFMCSNCGSQGWSPLEIQSMRYCPNCGRKMKLDDDGFAMLYEADGQTVYERKYKEIPGEVQP